MANLGIIDLPYLLRSRGGTMNDAQLFGVLLGEVKQPPHLEGLQFRDKHDRFALVDLVGIVTQTGKYYARGQVLVVVSKNILEAAKSKDSGRLAVVLNKGAIKLVDKGGLTGFVQMMKWSKGSYNSWVIGKVEAGSFKKADHPEFFNVVANAFKNNWQYHYPTTIAPSYMDACQGYDFEFVDQPTSKVPVGANVRATANAHPGLTEFGSEPQPLFSQPNNRVTPSIAPSTLGGLGEMNLGVSSSSNIATLVSNRALTHEEVKDKSKFAVVNRDKIADRTKNVEIIEDSIKLADAKVNAIIESLQDMGDDDSLEEQMDSIENGLVFTANQIRASWGSKVGYITGRMLFKEALERVLPDFDIRGSHGDTIITDHLNIADTGLVDLWEIGQTESEDKFELALVENRVPIYLKMIELFLGIRDKLSDALSAVEYANLDFFRILKTNPYTLCYVDPSIGIEDLDKLAMTFGVDIKDPLIAKSRNVAYMHNYMLDSSNKIIQENTVVKYNDLVKNVRAGYILGKRNYDTLIAEGTIIQRDRITSLQYYINSNVQPQNFQLPKTGWLKSFNKHVLQQSISTTDLVNDFIDSGLGVKMTLDKEDYVSDFVFVKKEMYIYNRLRELTEIAKKVEISDADIEKCVKKFEARKAKEFGLAEGEFKLEARQAEAVGLMRNPVMALTGPAGSGKTTTAEALVYGAETLLDIMAEDIMFCAPTGKAAHRLREVVKRKTRTINSLFGIGGDNVSLKSASTVKKREDIRLLVVDESSMPTVHLMYDMIRRVADGTRIFFLGDIEQLPPIGFGKPFATMLSFLPTVVLNVAKRATDKSTITRNAKAVIYESDGVVKDLEEGPDFRIVNTKDEQTVVDMIGNVVRYHLSKSPASNFTPISSLGANLHPDDIQIITPVNGKIWGTQALNQMLQNIFNPITAYDPAVNFSRGPSDKIQFRINDRVMHIKQNLPNRTRLIKVGKSSFIADDSTGVMNGEVGKVEGIYNWEEIDFKSVESESKREELEAEFKGNPNVMFLGVKFKDLDASTNEPIEYVILYRMEILNKSGMVTDVLSYDLNCLDLSYAATVHKLQGSQAKLVIMAMLPVGFGSFLSRNMIYTGISRAEKGEYFIGDIIGQNSCVNKARKIEKTSQRLSNIDNL